MLNSAIRRLGACSERRPLRLPLQGCGVGVGVGVGVARSRGNEPGVEVGVGADHAALTPTPERE